MPNTRNSLKKKTNLQQKTIEVVSIEMSSSIVICVDEMVLRNLLSGLCKIHCTFEIWSWSADINLQICWKILLCAFELKFDAKEKRCSIFYRTKLSLADRMFVLWTLNNWWKYYCETWKKLEFFLFSLQVVVNVNKLQISL